jgi:hypothetical protein
MAITHITPPTFTTLFGFVAPITYPVCDASITCPEYSPTLYTHKGLIDSAIASDPECRAQVVLQNVPQFETYKEAQVGTNLRRNCFFRSFGVSLDDLPEIEEVKKYELVGTTLNLSVSNLQSVPSTVPFVVVRLNSQKLSTLGAEQLAWVTTDTMFGSTEVAAGEIIFSSGNQTLSIAIPLNISSFTEATNSFVILTSLTRLARFPPSSNPAEQLLQAQINSYSFEIETGAQLFFGTTR